MLNVGARTAPDDGKCLRRQQRKASGLAPAGSPRSEPFPGRIAVTATLTQLETQTQATRLPHPSRPVRFTSTILFSLPSISHGLRCCHPGPSPHALPPPHATGASSWSASILATLGHILRAIARGSVSTVSQILSFLCSKLSPGSRIARSQATSFAAGHLSPVTSLTSLHCSCGSLCSSHTVGWLAEFKHT